MLNLIQHLFLNQSLVSVNKYYVYILSNKKRSTLYIGITNNLERRIFEHKTEIGSNFTKKYKLKDLVYFEECSDVISAIEREKKLKNWHKDWKWDLIKSFNNNLIDLSESWYDSESLKNIDSESSSE